MRKALFFYYNLKKIAAEWHRMLDCGESQFLEWFKQTRWTTFIFRKIYSSGWVIYFSGKIFVIILYQSIFYTNISFSHSDN